MSSPTGTTTTPYAGRHRSVDRVAPVVPGYDVGELLGEGGVGGVWAATSTSGAAVAVKVVPVEDVEGSLVELAVLGRVRDRHLVRLHEALALPTGEVALVLDRLCGGSVGALLAARGHLSAGEVVTVLSPVASAVARLHAVGVVHGDLSPGNVLLDAEGRPFVSDLGVARICGDRRDEVWGTDGFVAPEVLAGGLPTRAADVHALGALAWFGLTGEPPGPAALRPRLARRLPDLPEALREAVEGALRTRPEDRPSADELALALFEAAPAEPVVLADSGDDVRLLTRRVRAAARSGSAGPATQAPAGRLARWRASWAGRMREGARAAAPWLAVALVVLVIGAGVLAWTGRHDDARAVTPKAPTRDVAADGSSGATTAVDLRVHREAPRSDPRGLVQALADARAAAWSSGIAARLVEVDAPRSPALARDTESLAAVQRARQRYAGLAFTVREARLEPREGEGEVVTLRATIDTSAHVVRGPDGDVARPAVAGAPVLLDLVHTTAGWRVHDVRAV